MNEFYDNFKQLVSDDNIEDDVDNVIDLDGFNNEPSPMLNGQITKKDVRRNINKYKNGKCSIFPFLPHYF